MVDHNELLPEGMVLGGFRIESQIGHGNMGIIYRAIQVNLNRPVALKVLFKSVAADQDFVRSFFREAQAAAAFTHQNIVQAFDVGQSEEGIYYFAMELIQGGDISDYLKENGPYSAIDAFKLMVGIVDGLDYGSSLRKLTHGDIKPANIMLTKSNSPKLADLGLARMGGEIQGESDGIMLTPLYAAPEMIQGIWEVGDPRADMYSVGATLYHMITGAPPFNDDDYRNVIKMQVNNAHTPLHELDSEIPIELSKVVDKFLEKSPDNRYASWEEAKKAMETALKNPKGSGPAKKKKVLHYHKEEAHQRKKKKKASLVPLAIIVLILLGAGSYFMLSMKKNLSDQEYSELQKAFTKQSPKENIIQIKNFIDKYPDSTPTEALADLKKYQALVKGNGLFDVANLDLQEAHLNKLERDIANADKNTIHKLIQEQSKLANKLNKGLDTKGQTIHLPYDNSLQNHADFYTFENISSKGEPVFNTARVGDGIYLKGQSINYGNTSKASFSHSGKFSINLWIKPEKLTTPLLGKCEIANGKLNKGYLLSLNNGKVQFSLYGNSTENMLNMSTQKTLTENKWTHISVQYSNKKANLFINGRLSTCDTTSTLTENFASKGPLVIGSKYYYGLIDDVRIWSRTLNQQELEELVSFRSESRIEQLTKKYHQLIKQAHSNKTNPKPQALLNNGESNKQLLSLYDATTNLAKNFKDWEREAARLVDQINRIGTENKLYNFLRYNLEGCKQELIAHLNKREVMESLRKIDFKSTPYEGYKYYSCSKNGLFFRINSSYGPIQSRFYWDENETVNPLIFVYKAALEQNLIDPNPKWAVLMLIISRGSLYDLIVKKHKAPLIREFHQSFLNGEK